MCVIENAIQRTVSFNLRTPMSGLYPKFSKWWIKYGNFRPLLTSSHADMMLFVRGRGPQLKTPILLTWKHNITGRLLCTDTAETDLLIKFVYDIKCTDYSNNSQFLEECNLLWTTEQSQLIHPLIQVPHLEQNKCINKSRNNHQKYNLKKIISQPATCFDPLGGHLQADIWRWPLKGQNMQMVSLLFL